MSHRLRNLRIAAAVGMVLAAGAALTACQGDTSGKGSDGSDGTPRASAVASAGGGTATPTGTPDAATATPSAKADDGGGATATATAKGTTTTGTAATTPCRTSNLGFSFGPDSGAQAVGSPGGIEVVLSNKGSGTCALQGFPGLDIVSRSGTHWSLARQARSAGKVTLKPGAAASFEITYLPYDADDSGGSVAFQAASILVTPPGETHSTTLKWDGFADVMDQSGATHPGTYVGPVVAGK